jgi:O-acetyl-ADP-ribose deacetylase (regulator of RNase III)
MSLGGPTTEPNLRGSVRASLRLADSHDCASIAFPAIGAGIAGFPMDRCATVMKEEIDAHLAGGSGLETVYLILFGDAAFQAFKTVFEG